MIEDMLDEVFDSLFDEFETKLNKLGEEIIENYEVPESYNIYKKKLFEILDDNRGNFGNKALVYNLLSMKEEEKLYKYINSVFFNFQNLIILDNMKESFQKKFPKLDELDINQEIFKEKTYLITFIKTLTAKSKYILEYISVYLLKRLYFSENPNLILYVKGIESHNDINDYLNFNYEKFKNSLDTILGINSFNYNNLNTQRDFNNYIDNVFELKVEAVSYTYKNFTFNINGEPYDINEFFDSPKRKTISLITINNVLEELFHSKKVEYKEIKKIYDNLTENPNNSNAFYDLYNKSIKELFIELSNNFNEKDLGLRIDFDKEKKNLTLSK